MKNVEIGVFEFTKAALVSTLDQGRLSPANRPTETTIQSNWLSLSIQPGLVMTIITTLRIYVIVAVYPLG